MPWQSEDLKPGDRVAQAGVVLVEQALFADAARSPDHLKGFIKTPDASGKVEVDLPGIEFIDTKRQHDEDGDIINKKAYHEDVDTVTDAQGRKVMTIDEQEQGFLLDIITTNKFDCKTIIRGADSSLLYQLQGKAAATVKDGKFKDDFYVVFNGQGNQLPLRLELVGKATGNDSITITATTMVADQVGKPIPGWDGKPQILGMVEAKLNVDPNNPTGANFELKRTGRPLGY